MTGNYHVGGKAQAAALGNGLTIATFGSLASRQQEVLALLTSLPPNAVATLYGPAAHGVTEMAAEIKSRRPDIKLRHGTTPVDDCDLPNQRCFLLAEFTRPDGTKLLRQFKVIVE
jgi:hypothetical protein